jgi:nucleoside phosphorylase
MGRLMGPSRRTLAAAVLVGLCAAGVASTSAIADEPAPSACADRTLVLTAMPLELNPLITETALESQVVVEPEDQAPRTFYFGRLAGNDVVLAMTGIGMVNAEQTTRAAFAEFGACFRGVVFSGVAGSIYNIGDVAIAEEWTIHGNREGQGFTPVDPAMLATARQLEEPGAVELSRAVPVGDAACLCPGVEALTNAGLPITMPQPLKVVVGGQGTTYDTFSGHAVPCLPGGGDVAGCKPCITTPGFDRDAAAFAENAPPLLTDGDFFQGLFAFEETTDQYVAQDEETGPVAEVAAEHGVPFLGVRAASDGHGDPLGLPGFPFQFLAYRQLAGNNAAAVTIAFLEVWAAAGHPTA